MRARSSFLLLVLLAVCIVPGGATAAPSRLYAFGDSNVDTGNVFAAFGAPGGRSSNGLLVTEYVAQHFGIGLDNYAWGGATSGLTNVVGGGVAQTGLLNQIVVFENSLSGGGANAAGLYIVWAGSNDLVGIDVTDAAVVAARVAGVVANLTTAVTALDGLGARDVLVATRTPRPDLASANNLAGQTMNAAIRSLVPTLDASLAAQVRLFDAYALIEHMVLNPGHYGFTEATALCQSVPACAADLGVAEGYINWDAAHKTTRVHELMAGAMIAQVPEPESVVLMSLGLFFVAAVMRRRGRRAQASPGGNLPG